MKLLGGKEEDSSDAIKPTTSLNKGNYFQLGSIWDELENGDAISPPSSSSSSYTKYKISSNSRIYSKVIRDMAITTPPRGNTPQVLSPIKEGNNPLSPIGSSKRLKPSFVNPTASEHRRSPPSFVSYDDQVS